KSGGRVLDDPSLVAEFRANELSRRALLQGALAVAAGTVAAGCSSGASPTTMMGGDAGTDSGLVHGSHLVGMGYSDDHDTAVRNALAETVSLSFVRPGDTVYFKVN